MTIVFDPRLSGEQPRYFEKPMTVVDIGGVLPTREAMALRPWNSGKELYFKRETHRRTVTLPVPAALKGRYPTLSLPERNNIHSLAAERAKRHS